MKPADHDLAIVGGGPVGALLACGLAAHGGRVVLLEGTPATGGLPPSYDGRAIALALGSQDLLAAYGAWDGLAAAASPMLRIDIAQQRFPGRTLLDCAGEGVPAFGYVVSGHDLGQALYARLDRAGVRVLRGARVDALHRARGQVRLGLAGSGEVDELGARLVVAADGARSAVRALAGISAHHTDYAQRALIAEVVPGIPHAGTAYERFTPHGPLALLPRGAGCALVWTLPDTDCARLLELDEPAFLAELQRAFGGDLGTFRAVRERRAYPLHGLRVERLVRGRVALAGNAAHTLHPIAGQGLNLGVRDVARLVALLDDALAHGDDPGDSRRLAVYARERAAEHARAYSFTDGLLALFAGSALPLRLARGAGLAGFGRLPLLRHRLAAHTMGRAGRG
ncbi:MAG TPA: FAD-dependent monooxygenase [Gammaproteobacteria bacterium]